MRGVVREGYRVLLRGEVRLWLPVARERICNYYERVGEACLRWAEKGEGERLRERYLALASHEEQARFPMARYSLTCEPIWEEEDHVGMLCRSVLREGERAEKRCMAQVWRLSEETLLPPRRIREVLKASDGVRRRILSAKDEMGEEALLEYFGKPAFASRFGRI